MGAVLVVFIAGEDVGYDEVSPRIILLDIETSPNMGYSWGRFEQNILKFEKEWELLSFAYKVLGTPANKTLCFARCDYNDKTERALVKEAHSVLDSADIIIGHNIDRFDNKKLRAKFVEHGLAPPKPYKTIDTLKIARSQFAFNSNSLNDLAFTLKLGRKVQTGGIELWFGCMAGDPKAWKKMIAYNKHDVVLLEKVYQRLKTWYPHHPNLALYNDDREGCPVCSSGGRVQRRGTQVLQQRIAQRYQCQSCGHWFHRKKVA
jgi:hypothetical protein